MKRKPLLLALGVILVMALYFTGCGSSTGGTTTGGTSPTPTASPTTGNWTSQTVDSNAFQMGDLQFDTSGTPWMTYSTNGDGSQYRPMTIAHYNGTGWTIQTIDSNVFAAPGSTIDFNDSGNPGVVYTDKLDYSSSNDGTVKYALYDGDSWYLEDVARGTGSSFQFNSSNQPCVVYYCQETDNLIYAVRTGVNIWDKTTVASGSDIDGFTSRFMFDPSGNPGILYKNGSAQDWTLNYLHYNGSSWDSSSLVNSTYLAGHNFDYSTDGSPHVVYGAYSETVGWVNGFYMYYNGSEWVKKQYTDKYGADPALQMDNSGIPHVMSTNGYSWLVYGTLGSSGYVFEEIVPNDNSGAVGQPVPRSYNGGWHGGYTQLNQGAMYVSRKDT